MHYDQLPLHHFAKDIKRQLKKGNSKGLIFGNFGACNVGDEAILAGELAELRTIPTTTVRVISRYPQKVKNLHGVDSVPFFSLPSVIKNIIGCDYIIFGGGGLICKNDTGLRGILFQLYTIGMFLLLPLVLRKKVFIVGLGIYENTPLIILRLAIFLFSFVHLLGVRDSASYELLKKHQLPVKEYKDSSFLLSLDDVSQKPLWKNSDRLIVGLALNKPQKVNDAQKLISEIAAFILTHRKTTHFVFYALDYHPHYSNDRRFASKIIKQVEKTSLFSYEFVQMQEHPRLIFSSFLNLSFMIASRLHGSLFSYRLGVPFYGIAYDAKCASFLSSINHQYTWPDSITASDISLYYQSLLQKTMML